MMYIMLECEDLSAYSDWMQLGGAASPLTLAYRCHATEVKNRSVSCYDRLQVIRWPLSTYLAWMQSSSVACIKESCHNPPVDH